MEKSAKQYDTDRIADITAKERAQEMSTAGWVANINTPQEALPLLERFTKFMVDTKRGPDICFTLQPYIKAAGTLHDISVGIAPNETHPYGIMMTPASLEAIKKQIFSENS